MLTVRDPELQEQTREFARRLVSIARENQIQAVLLSAAWSAYADDPQFEQQLAETVDAFRSAGIHVAILLDVATFPDQVPKSLAAHAFFSLPTSDLGVTSQEYQNRNQRAESVIRRIAQGRADILDPSPALVDSHGTWRAEIDGQAQHRDNSHLTVEDSLRTIEVFAEWISTLAP